MPILDIFSIPVVITIKTRLFAISTFTVFILMTGAVVLPLAIAYQAGGFWLRNRMYVETPTISFMYKYLMLAEKDINVPPVVCSTFSHYQSAPINDDCTIIKVQEIDVDKDTQKDVMKFSANFWSDQPIKTIKLLLWFEFQLKDIIEHRAETLLVYDAILPHDCQELKVIGQLKLIQKGIVQKDNFFEFPNNQTIELTDYSLDEVLSHYSRKIFNVQLANTQVIQQKGFADDMPITISAEVYYPEQIIHYKPTIWEELKWAWIQYLSILFVTLYWVKRILRSFFTKGRLRSYIVTPWKQQKLD